MVCFRFSGYCWQRVTKKNKVKLLKAPKKKSEVVAELPKGTVLESSSRKGMYWEVKTSDGKTGFVSVMKVKRQAGSSKGNLASALKAAVRDGRSTDEASNSRARSAVMGVRGLDKSDKASMAGNVKPNLRMVYRMEDRSVSQNQIDELNEAIYKEIEARAKKRGIEP